MVLTFQFVFNSHHVMGWAKTWYEFKECWCSKYLNGIYWLGSGLHIKRQQVWDQTDFTDWLIYEPPPPRPPGVFCKMMKVVLCDRRRHEIRKWQFVWASMPSNLKNLIFRYWFMRRLISCLHWQNCEEILPHVAHYVNFYFTFCLNMFPV